MTDILSALARLLQRVFYPPVCLICGQSGQAHMDCCPGCLLEIAVAPGRCRRCALALPRTVEYCGRCALSPPHYEAAYAGFVYAGPVAWLVQRFKFRRDLAAGRLLAVLVATRLAALGAPRPDLMVPVPLHAGRRITRGFNQSEWLCRDLSRHFGGLPWHPALIRQRATATQSELPARGRRGNVRGAFMLRRLPAGTRMVALVDDVMTTGATLDECARVLKQAGVSVEVWVVARA